MSSTASAHYVPGLDHDLRTTILQALRTPMGKNNSRPVAPNVRDGGTYVQSQGPRFETKAEIKHMSTQGDVIGMTAAHEATLAGELKVPYAIVAFVDNMAHGVTSSALSLDQFHQAQADNKLLVETSVQAIVDLVRAQASSKQVFGQGPVEKKAKRTTNCDLVVKAQYGITCDRASSVFKQGMFVAVKDGVIVGVGEEGESVHWEGRQVLELGPEACLMPGLINAHTHTPMVFMRGFGDDMPLTQWLATKIWPAEGKCMDAAFVKEGTLVACAEMLKSGTTCMNDMYFFAEDSMEVLERVGMRAMVGLVVVAFPSKWGSGPEEYFEKGTALFEEWERKKQAQEVSDRVSFTMSPHATYSVCESDLLKCKHLAQARQIPFHTHMHECKAECEDSLKGDRSSMFCHQSEAKSRPLANFDKLGLLDSSCVLAHMTQLTEEEIALCSRTALNVVHCPSSNMKLASGMCEVDVLMKQGVNVCLGTDGAASNNTLDMFAEMKLAALLGAAVAGDARAVSAQQAICMATINGAKALGLDAKTGSLEVGKVSGILDRRCVVLLFVFLPSRVHYTNFYQFMFISTTIDLVLYICIFSKSLSSI